MQLVAIEIGNAFRTIEQRPRPARCGVVDCRKRLAAFLGIGCDDDSDVVIGQRLRQTDTVDDVKRQQLNVATFEQKFDRRVAAHVDGRRKREHAHRGLYDSARRAEQLVESEHLGLDRKTRFLVAEKLGDPTRAAEHLEAALALDEKSAETLGGLADLYRSAGLPRE